MASLKKFKSDQLHEGIVARSSTEWADLVMKSMGIDKDDPDKNKRLWGYEIKENVFSSGSDLTLDDYLRLRVVWYTWTSLKTLGNHMRDNDDPERDSEDTGRTKTPYQGFVSHASDLVANKIYTSIKALPEWTAYLDDIRQGGVDGDGTRPSLECGILFMARYWQAMSLAQLKENYGEHDVKELFRGKVRKSEAGMIKPHVHTGALQIRPLSTPSKRIQPHLSHQGFGTPLISNPGPSAGGKQNPATADETYVNTALLLLLQAVTRLMIDCHRQITTSSNTGSSKSKDTRGSEVQARKPSLLPTKKKTLASSRGNKGKETEGASASRGSSSQSGAVTKEIGNQDATDLVKKLSGLCYLDWMADRLPLVLTDRSGLDTEPTRLMEARIDGYLCRRDFIRDSSPSPRLHTRFNKYPLAILEAKPCTRRSGITPIRWQESAEIASWVSGLDEKYESAGLLRTSTSGRKRRLLISQDRHELWITVAEYGDAWKQYIRGNTPTLPTALHDPGDVEKLAGSEGFVALAKLDNADRFKIMTKEMARSSETTEHTTQIPGPEHFCMMNQWGPFKTDNADHMDLFLRRVTAFQVELLNNWPSERFEFPVPA